MDTEKAIRAAAAALVLAAAAGTGAAQAPAGPVTEEEVAATRVRLEVDLSERTLAVMRGDAELRSYPVAVGRPEHPTPQGEFRISRVVWNPRWVPPPGAEWARDERPKEPGDADNPMGRVKMFFQEPDYYIHGTHAEESLGRAASHGCIRMADRDVVDLARVVMEHGGERRPPGWFRRVVNLVTRTREVRLSRPVPVVVRE